MSKLSATLAKKVPLPGVEYSSQQFSCGLEMELPGEQTQETIRQHIRRVYALLHEAIDEEIQEAMARPPAFVHALKASSNSVRPVAQSPERWSSNGYGNNTKTRWNNPRGGNQRGYGGNGNGNYGQATQAQVKAIFAIAKANGMERGELIDLLEDRFNVSQPEQLSIKQASKVIEELKSHSAQ